MSISTSNSGRQDWRWAARRWWAWRQLPRGFRIRNPLLLRERLKTALTSPLSGVKSSRRGCGWTRLLRGWGCRLVFPADVQHKSKGCTLAVPFWLGQAFAEAKGGCEQRGKINQHHYYTRISRFGPLFQRVSRSTKSCSTSFGAKDITSYRMRLTSLAIFLVLTTSA